MTTTPSPRQLAAYRARPARRPVVLVYQYEASGAVGVRVADALARLAAQHGGRLGWKAEAEQILIGALPAQTHVLLLHFPDRAQALGHVLNARHAKRLRGVESLQLSVVSEQKALVRWVTGLMARVLPWLPFDQTVDPGPEPGLGTSIMPSEAGLASFLAHPRQDTPVVMVNWLRFREQAQYASPPEAPLSGKAAYYRYGQIAFATLHSLGARAFFVSRYQQQIPIGNDGDPCAALWDEFVLVRYPGRACFKHMTRLQRYRRARIGCAGLGALTEGSMPKTADGTAAAKAHAPGGRRG